MSDIAIQAERIGKLYRLGPSAPYHRFTELLSHGAKAPLRWARRLCVSCQDEKPPQDDFLWALDDVSFEVQHGEVVGFIGHNGAGKSTLLKILSRITDPTRGRAAIYGRVGSLLEVGTGFHPELTGRENIFLGGAVLGMTRAEVNRNFDEIVAFADIERFLDTPVKRYSSGMYMRLAFSVSAHLEPEILLVDEVLAVGDVQFQSKCLGKMSTMAKQGRTVLFVSHHMSAVQSMCERVIRLDKGKLVDDGPAAEVVSRYLSEARNEEREHSWDDMETAPGNDTVRFRRAAVRLAEGTPDAPITTRTPVELVFEFWNRKPGLMLNLSLLVCGKEGSVAFITGPSPDAEWSARPFPAGLFRSTCSIPGDLLNDGLHSVLVQVTEGQARALYRHPNMLVFHVLDDGSQRLGWHGEWRGAVRPILNWRTEPVEERVPEVGPA